MKHTPLIASLLVCALGTAAPAMDDVPMTAEVLPGWTQPDGHRMAALRLSLAPGWKTYWRAPGDAGIPPSFDWSGSRNLASVAIVWPTPHVFDQNGMRSVGYKNELVIPLRIAPREDGKPVNLRVAMELGICSDICIPHALSIDATLDGDTADPTPAIVAALAATPFSAAEAGVRGATCRLTPIADGLQIEARLTMPSAGSPEHVVIEPGPEEIWVSEAETRRSGGEIVAVADMIHFSGDAFALDRSDVRFTVLGSEYAVDIRGCTPG